MDIKKMDDLVRASQLLAPEVFARLLELKGWLHELGDLEKAAGFLQNSPSGDLKGHMRSITYR